MVLSVRRNTEREGKSGWCFQSGGIERGQQRENVALRRNRELVGENWLQIICGAPTTLAVK